MYQYQEKQHNEKANGTKKSSELSGAVNYLNAERRENVPFSYSGYSGAVQMIDLYWECKKDAANNYTNEVAKAEPSGNAPKATRPGSHATPTETYARYVMRENSKDFKQRLYNTSGEAKAAAAAAVGAGFASELDYATLGDDSKIDNISDTDDHVIGQIFNFKPPAAAAGTWGGNVNPAANSARERFEEMIDLRPAPPPAAAAVAAIPAAMKDKSGRAAEDSIKALLPAKAAAANIANAVATRLSTEGSNRVSIGRHPDAETKAAGNYYYYTGDKEKEAALTNTPVIANHTSDTEAKLYFHKEKKEKNYRESITLKSPVNHWHSGIVKIGGTIHGVKEYEADGKPKGTYASVKQPKYERVGEIEHYYVNPWV